MSLKIWLPLTNNTNNYGTCFLQKFSFNSLTQQTDGKLGKCYSGRAIYHLNEELIDNSWSLCAWVKSASWSQYNDIILCKNTSASDNCQFYFSIINGSTLNLGINAGTSSASFSYTFATNTWYHVAATYNGSAYALYINGDQKKTGTITNTLKTGMNNIGINCRSLNTDGTSWTGDEGKKVNDVRIYDNCLSPLEIKELSQGLVLHYKLDKPQSNLLTATPKTYSPTAYNAYQLNLTENLVVDQTYTLQLWNVDVSHSAKNSSTLGVSVYWGGGNIQLLNMAGTSNFTDGHADYLCQTFTVTSSQASGNGATNLWLNLYNSIPNANGTRNMSIGAWKLEKGSIPTPWAPTVTEQGGYIKYIPDDSGYDHNGEILNGPLTYVSDISRHTNCIHFSDTNQKIKISNLLTSSFGNSYTFAWWAKISSVSPMHWGFSDGIRLNGMYAGHLWNTGDSANNPLYNPGTTTQVTDPTINTWHHWVMTGDGSKCRVYKDGVLWAEAKTYKSISGTTIYINGWDTSTSYSSNNYSISDFRIYATALDAAAIKNLYEVSAFIDNQNSILPFGFNELGKNILIKNTGIIESTELNEDSNVLFTNTNKIFATEFIER